MLLKQLSSFYMMIYVLFRWKVFYSMRPILVFLMKMPVFLFYCSQFPIMLTLLSHSSNIPFLSFCTIRLSYMLCTPVKLTIPLQFYFIQLSLMMNFSPKIVSIPQPLPFVMTFLNMKLLILSGPSMSKLHLRLASISFFSRKTEHPLDIWTPLPKILLILFIKICGDARLQTLMPYWLLNLI